MITGTRAKWYIFVPLGIFTTYIQQSINVFYHTNSLRQMLNSKYKRWSQLDEDQRTALENNIFWAISLNPIFPIIARFKCISTVIIELVHFGLLTYSTFVIVHFNMRAPGKWVIVDNNVQFTLFFSISWMLIASPVIALLLRAILGLVLGIPLLIYICKEK